MRYLCSLMFLFWFLTGSAQECKVEIHPDCSVTFHLTGVTAKRVKLESTFAKRQKMKKVGEEWTLTTSPLEPGLHNYRMLIDKHAWPDTTGVDVQRDVEKYFRWFIIPDSITSYYLDRPDIPHGTVSYHWYYSTLNGMSQRRLALYTPPGYQTNDSLAQDSLPVLYLLHGSGGDETAWIDDGRVCQILDELYYEGKIAPMFVVMPNGNVNLDAAPGESPWMKKEPTAQNIASMAGQFENSFVKEIVKYIDHKFPTLTDKQHRAIAGLSLGGLHTVYISLNNPDTFGYVGLFSAQTTNMLDNRKILMINRASRNLDRLKKGWGLIFNFVPDESIFDEKLDHVAIYENLEGKLARQFQNPPSLYYIAIGREDKLKRFDDQFRALLDAHDYPYYYNETSGAHSWENWRRYLVDFLPRLFKNK